MAIRYGHTWETAEYAEEIGKFLQQNGFAVYLTGVTMSEIKRNEFSKERHPAGLNFAKIKIGPFL